MLHYINYIVFFFDQREASKKEIDVTTLFSWNAWYGAVRQSREYVARITRVAINFPLIIWTVLENASSAWHIANLPNLFIHWFNCILCTAGTSIENCCLKLLRYCLVILKLVYFFCLRLLDITLLFLSLSTWNCPLFFCLHLLEIHIFLPSSA